MPRQSAPAYLGCITLPAGRPTLLFSGGFLVQDDPDPTRTGWYRFNHHALVQTHVNEDHKDAFAMTAMTPALLDLVYGEVLHQFLLERQQADLGNAIAPAADQRYFLLADTDEIENGRRASIYLFNGRLTRAGDARLPAAWQLAPALQALGPLDANGQPTLPPHRATAPGLIRFG